jgi:hypothetical protein
LEHCAAGSLERPLAPGGGYGPLPEPLAAAIMSQVLSGLAYLHSQVRMRARRGKSEGEEEESEKRKRASDGEKKLTPIFFPFVSPSVPLRPRPPPSEFIYYRAWSIATSKPQTSSSAPQAW